MLSNSHSSVDDVSRSTIDLFNHLIISLYRRFMTNNNRIIQDDELKKCLVSKAFDIEALPKQRELLYIITSCSSLIQIFCTLLTYIDADIQRLRATASVNSNQCVQRYAREALCPICASESSFFHQISNNHDGTEILCENDCQYIIKSCLSQMNDSYVAWIEIAKNYSDIVREIEQAVVELKVSICN